MHGFTLDRDLSEEEEEEEGQSGGRTGVEKRNTIDERDHHPSKPRCQPNLARKKDATVVDLCDVSMAGTHACQVEGRKQERGKETIEPTTTKKIHPMFLSKARNKPHPDGNRTQPIHLASRTEEGTRTIQSRNGPDVEPKVVYVVGSEDEAPSPKSNVEETTRTRDRSVGNQLHRQCGEGDIGPPAKRKRTQTTWKPIHVQNIQPGDLPTPTQLHSKWMRCTEGRSDTQDGPTPKLEAMRFISIPMMRTHAHAKAPKQFLRPMELDPKEWRKDQQQVLDRLGRWAGHRDGYPARSLGTELDMEERWRRQLEWHDGHTCSELTWRAGYGGELQWMSSCPRPLWTEKHRPDAVDRICNNATAKLMLTKWLEEWKRNPHRAWESANLLRRRKEAVKDWGLNSEKDLVKELGMRPGQLEEEECWLSSGILLAGPCASGKTSLVYACAKEMGFRVKEVTTSDKRTGKELTNLIGEATQSKRLDYPQHMVGGNDARERGMDAGNAGEQAPTSNEQSTLILVEDVDVVFEEDRGFVSALSALVKAARRPVVLTCSSNARPWVMNEVRLASIETRLPVPEELVPLLACIAHAEGLELSCRPEVLQELAQICGGDPRRAILELQSLGRLDLVAWEQGRAQQTMVDSSGSEATHELIKVFCSLPSRTAHAPRTSGTSTSLHKRVCKAIFAAHADAEGAEVQALAAGLNRARALRKEKVEHTKWDLGTVNRAKKGRLIELVKKMEAEAKMVKKNELPLVRASHHQDTCHCCDKSSPGNSEVDGLDHEEQKAIHIARRAIARALAGEEDHSFLADNLSSEESDETLSQEQSTTPSLAVQDALDRLRTGGYVPKYRPPKWESECIIWTAVMADQLSVSDTLCMPSYEQTIHGPSKNRGYGKLDEVEDPMLCALGELGDLQGLNTMVSSRASETVASLALQHGTKKIEDLIHLDSRAVPEANKHSRYCARDGDPLEHFEPSPATQVTLWGMVQDVSPSLAVSRSSSVLADLTSFSARISRAEHARLESAQGRHKKNFVNHLQKSWGLPYKYNSYLVAFGHFPIAGGKVSPSCPV